MRFVTTFIPVCLYGFAGHADDLPSGIVNTQNPDDVSLSPQDSLARITVPGGFIDIFQCGRRSQSICET
ncbi:MAG: hypothetical protein VB858_02630 [Planctomycetaceae bacterium]